MDFSPSISSTGLAAAVLLLLTLVLVRIRQRQPTGRKARREALDTVADWQPEAARVLTVDERQAYELLRRALPSDFVVLAQVPLSRFLRVPMRHSYADWLQRVGHLSADLLVCDAGSRVLMAIDIRALQESERSQRRHERLARVLRAAGIRVQVWREGELPSVSEVRALIAAILGESAPVLAAALREPAATSSAPGRLPLIPVADIAEILAEGDRLDHSMEPVASGFYDDFDLVPQTASK
jgi:hypothetical protein